MLVQESGKDGLQVELLLFGGALGVNLAPVFIVKSAAKLSHSRVWQGSRHTFCVILLLSESATCDRVNDGDAMVTWDSVVGIVTH